jgi:flagellar motor switch protein FliG
MPDAKQPLSGEDKAALLLKSLQPEVAESVLSRMGQEQAHRLRVRLAELNAEPERDRLREIAQEFFDLLRISDRTVHSAEGKAETGQADQTPAEAAAGEGEPFDPDDPVQALGKCRLDVLAAALREERAGTIALVLGCLQPDQTADLLRRLPPETRQEAVVRLGQVTSVNQELLRQVARAILEKCQSLADKPPEPTVDEKLRMLADVVRGLGREDRMEVLQRLDAVAPESAEKVRKQLYRFGDLLKIDDRTLQGLLTELDVKSVALALKGADEDIKTKVLSNVSSRARETVLEEMDLMGTIAEAKIEEARGLVITIIQRLDAEGKLSLS